jgi:hypothetical protein
MTGSKQSSMEWAPLVVLMVNTWSSGSGEALSSTRLSVRPCV